MLRSRNTLTETEPLNEDGSSPHREAQTMKLKMEDKMVQIKKTRIDFNTPYTPTSFANPDIYHRPCTKLVKLEDR